MPTITSGIIIEEMSQLREENKALKKQLADTLEEAVKRTEIEEARKVEEFKKEKKFQRDASLWVLGSAGAAIILTAVFGYMGWRIPMG